MKYLPVNLNIQGRQVLVVGGGNIAFRKVESLLECGAKVKVVAPEITDELAAIKGVEFIRRAYACGDMRGACLVICATSSADVNRAVHADAVAGNIPVNVVDQPDLCTFIFPSVFTQGDLVISASTGGASPTVAKQIREMLHKVFGPEWGQHIELLGAMRAELKDSSLTMEERSAIAKRLAEPCFRDLIKNEGMEKAREAAGRIIEEAQSRS